MKATGIVRRIDDLGRVVIPKEIRRTLRIREGDPSHTTLTLATIKSILESIIDRYQLTHSKAELLRIKNIYNR